MTTSPTGVLGAVPGSPGSEAARTPAHYREDLQGLRGLAVLLVVAFHAGLPLSGGYVGVDVFFALSGFVIGGLLLRESGAAGRVRLGEFYARRVRRLLPALATMSVVTLLVSVVVLSPDGTQQAAATTAAAASLSVSNLQLWRAGGYFSPRLESNPFLHTWSLSVEEQFYLFLPVTVAVTWALAVRLGRSPRRLLVVVITAISAASLASSVLLTRGVGPVPNPARFAFFGPVTRVWEFAAGVLLAVLARRLPRSEALGRAAGLVGVVAVLAAAVVFDAATPFPGLLAVVPVAGTLLLISGGTMSDAAARSLGTRPLRGIGDLSYSWYLWHWPFIVFARVVWPDSRIVMVAAAVVSLLPARWSYRFIEWPFRLRADLRGRRAVLLGVSCAVVPLLLALTVRWTADRWRWWLDGVGDYSQAHRNGCLHEVGFRTWDEEACTFPAPDSTGTVLLLGDSHTTSIADAVLDAAHRNDMDLVVWNKASCPVWPIATNTVPGCSTWQEEVLDLAARLRPDVVVVAHRSPWHVTGYPTAGSPDATDDDQPAPVRREWAGGLARSLARFDAMGARTLVVGTVPRYPSPPSASLMRPGGRSLRLDRDEVARQRGPVIDDEKAVVAGSATAAYYDPIDDLCNRSCGNTRNGVPIYNDDDHLGRAGSLLLADPLSEQIRGLIDQPADG